MAGKELAVESGVELLPLRAGGPTLVLGNLSSGVVLAEKVSEIGRLVELKDGKEFFFFSWSCCPMWKTYTSAFTT
jgi:iron only hydrogenase large subunit-like protein